MTNTILPNKQIKRSLQPSSCPTSPTISEQSNSQINIEKPKKPKNLEDKLLESKKIKKTPQDQIKKLKKATRLKILLQTPRTTSNLHKTYFLKTKKSISLFTNSNT